MTDQPTVINKAAGAGPAPAGDAAATAATLVSKPATASAAAATVISGSGAAASGDHNARTAATILTGGRPDANAATRVTGGAPPAPAGNALDQLVGRAIGGCEILSLLGRGGMGAVFKANQVRLNRTVALKVLLPEHGADTQFADRFVREARVVAALNHPNVVQVYDAGADDKAGGMLYMLMEFVEGKTLGQVLKGQGVLPIPVALAVLRQAAEGLAAAHLKMLVHRDIKPDNLMVDVGCRVKVMDFGLARPTSGGDANLTTSGMILGTPNYISPEAARGETTDIRSDLYSLGITAWQMVAGRLPFSAPTPVQVMVQHLEMAPPDLATISKCPPAVAQLVAKMIAKDPAQRFADPTALVAAIDDLERKVCGGAVRLAWSADRLITTSQVQAEAVAAPASGGRGGLLAFTAGAVLAIGGGLWFALRPDSSATSATDPALTAKTDLAAKADPAKPVTPPPAKPPAVGPAAVKPETGPEVATKPPADPPAAPVKPEVRSEIPAPPTSPADPAPAALVKAPSEPVKLPTAPAVAVGTSPPAVASAPTAPPIPPATTPVAVKPESLATTAPPPPTAPPPSAPITIKPEPSPPAIPPVAPTAPATPVVAAVPSAPEIPAPKPASAPAVPAPAPAAPVVLVPAPQLVNRLPGGLNVASVPAGADVYLDGVHRGKTPLLLRDIPPGRHQLRLSKAGYLEEGQPVVVTGGRVTAVANPLPRPAFLELTDLPNGAGLAAAGLAYEPGMMVPAGPIEIQIALPGQEVQKHLITVQPGPNKFSFAKLP